MNQQARGARVEAACKMMQDPRILRSGAGRKIAHVPVYEVVLTAKAAGGGTAPRATLQVAADEPVRLRLDRGDGQDLMIMPGKPAELRAGATGAVRVTIDALGFRTGGRTVLRCPLLKVRTGDMPADQWEVVAPDRQAHTELGEVTGQALLSGRPARNGRQATKSPLKAGVSRADADDLAATIRGLMGATGASKLELDSSGPVAFASGDAPVAIEAASGPDLVGRVNAADAPLQRTIAPLELPMPDGEAVSFAAGEADGDTIYEVDMLAAHELASDGDEAQSFGTAEPASRMARAREQRRELLRMDSELREAKQEEREARRKQRADKARQFANELKEFLKGALLQPLAGLVDDLFTRAKDSRLVVVDTIDPKGVLLRTWQIVVDYGNKVVRAVVDSVDSALGLMAGFCERLGAKCEEMIQFLAALFDWGDVLETADGLLAAQQNGLKRLPGYIKTARERWAGLTGSLEAALVKAIDGAVASLQGGAAQPPRSPSPSSAPDERSSFLFTKVENNLEHAGKQFSSWTPGADIIAEIEKALDLNGALKGIDAPAIWKEFKDSLSALELGDMFTSMQEFFRDGASALLVGLRAFVKLLVRVLTVAGDLVLRFIDVLLDVAVKALNLHLEIPFLTDFIEESILGGRQLTLLTLLSVLAAVPFTIAHKLAHGVEHGPFGGPVSFAGGEDEKKVKRFNDTVAAYINVACSCVIGVVVTVVDLADDKMAAPRILKVVSSAAGLVICGVTGFPTDNSDPNAYGLAVTNWTVGLVGAAIGIADAGFGLYLTIKKKENEAIEDAFRYVSGGIGLLQLALAIAAGAVDTTREKKKPAADQDVGLVWLGASGNIIGGLVSAMPIIPDEPKQLKIAKVAVASTLIVAQTAIGIAYCVQSGKAEG